MTAAIVTSDRPDRLDGCLSSYLTDRTAPASILLMDDSRDPVSCIAARDATARAGRRFHVSVRYAGRAEREKYVNQLCREGIPEATGRFCLLGKEGDWFTAGAARNAVLLDSLGEKIVMLDDDTRGDTAVRAERSSNVILSGHEDPCDLDFFRSREEATAAVEWKSVDLFGDAERFLGTRLDLMAADSAGACHHLRALVKDGNGVVRMTSCGVVGDSGNFSPVHLLWMASPATTKRLRESDSILATSLSSREVVRLVRQPTITHAAVCMATAIGLDNRRILPPFLPIGRNEDGFFGNLLLRCFPEACTAHLPYAVLHQAPGHRRYQRLSNDAQTIRIAELIILLLSAYPVAPGTAPFETFRLPGAYLSEISRSARGFVLNAREIVRAARRSLLNQIEEKWGDFDGFSDLWRTEIRQFRTRIRELIASPDCWQPLELRGMSPDGIADVTRELVSLTGDMLTYWPSIADAVPRLLSKDVRISRPV
jgi:uncharacterized protein YbaR (Trm112 family)